MRQEIGERRAVVVVVVDDENPGLARLPHDAQPNRFWRAGVLRTDVVPGTGSGNRGKSIVKMHPEPAKLRTLRTPLFASTLLRQMDRPSPWPDLSGPVCTNGRNIFSAWPGARPPHWSSTSIRMRSATAWALSETLGRFVNLKAFCNRLPTAE